MIKYLQRKNQSGDFRGFNIECVNGLLVFFSADTANLYEKREIQIDFEPKSNLSGIKIENQQKSLELKLEAAYKLSLDLLSLIRFTELIDEEVRINYHGENQTKKISSILRELTIVGATNKEFYKLLYRTIGKESQLEGRQLNSLVTEPGLAITSILDNQEAIRKNKEYIEKLAEQRLQSKELKHLFKIK